MTRQSVLVTGATGYIGGRLVPRLLDAGYRVHCLARSPRKLAARPWADHPEVRIFEGDLAQREQVAAALDGCSAAYYLVHSMLAAGEDYANEDRALARNFTAAASATPSMRRILYLGGLGETGAELSEHLSSRREVERELGAGTLPVTTLRAAMIIGSGSASFEILRYLVERLPMMITPRWVQTESQPIAVRNVLDYLVRALEVETTTGRILDIGGPEILSYRELMRTMAEALGLPNRFVLPVPVLTPQLELAVDPSRDAAEPAHRPPSRRGAAQPGRVPFERGARAHAAAAAEGPRSHRCRTGSLRDGRRRDVLERRRPHPGGS